MTNTASILWPSDVSAEPVAVTTGWTFYSQVSV
jgi:hypothetical protein